MSEIAAAIQISISIADFHCVKCLFVIIYSKQADLILLTVLQVDGGTNWDKM